MITKACKHSSEKHTATGNTADKSWMERREVALNVGCCRNHLQNAKVSTLGMFVSLFFPNRQPIDKIIKLELN